MTSEVQCASASSVQYGPANLSCLERKLSVAFSVSAEGSTIFSIRDLKRSLLAQRLLVL